MSFDPDRPCPHEVFGATVDVSRLTDVEDGPVTGYRADVRISCAVCGEAFRFRGVEEGAGWHPSKPTTGIRKDELRLPIYPSSEDADFGLGIPPP